jgi:hypothetical protein
VRQSGTSRTYSSSSPPKFVGCLESPQQIASIVAEQRADAVELYLGAAGGVLLLWQLLRELIAVGRRDVSIVVHRVEKLRQHHHGALGLPEWLHLRVTAPPTTQVG